MMGDDLDNGTPSITTGDRVVVEDGGFNGSSLDTVSSSNLILVVSLIFYNSFVTRSLSATSLYLIRQPIGNIA